MWKLLSVQCESYSRTPSPGGRERGKSKSAINRFCAEASSHASLEPNLQRHRVVVRVIACCIEKCDRPLVHQAFELGDSCLRRGAGKFPLIGADELAPIFGMAMEFPAQLMAWRHVLEPQVDPCLRLGDAPRPQPVD